jgi:hypothetical protein
VLVVAGGVGDTPTVSSTVEMLDLDASAGRSAQEFMNYSIQYLWFLMFFALKAHTSLGIPELSHLVLIGGNFP